MTVEPSRRMGRPPATINGRTVPERLVEVALRLFADRGFEGTSVEDVVSAAGVTKGAMYHYFHSKDDLLAEIYARVLREQMQRLEAFVHADVPIEERVFGAAADVVVTTIEHLDSTTVFFRSLHQLSEAKQKEVRSQRRRYHDAFRGMVLEGQRAGAFRDDIAADLVVDYFFGSALARSRASAARHRKHVGVGVAPLGEHGEQREDPVHVCRPGPVRATALLTGGGEGTTLDAAHKKRYGRNA